MKKLGLLFVLTITFAISYAQQRTISGTITLTEDGSALKGVKIILLEKKVTRRREVIYVESKIETKTNEKGEYKLNVPDTEKNIIRFKKPPYSTKDIKLGDRKELDLSMELLVRQGDKKTE